LHIIFNLGKIYYLYIEYLYFKNIYYNIYKRMDNPTHTYLDINLVNNKINADDTSPTPIIFNTRRDADYLANPQDYYVSVIRWSLDCRLPLIVPQLVLGSSVQSDTKGDYFDSVYVITIQAPSGYYGESRVKFRTQTSISPPPFSTITDISILYDTPYFYINSVQYFMDLVNDAFDEAWAALKLAQGGSAGFPDRAPFLQYNYDGNFTLLATPSYITTASPRLTLYFNSALYTLFNGLSAIQNGWVNSTATPIRAKNYQILIDDGQTTTINGVVWNYCLTEYPTLPFWSPVSSIVFTSQGIPVEPTNSNPTNAVGNATNLGAVNNNINLASVITDFDINLNTGTEPRQIVYYATAGEYRFFDLNSNTPLADININAGWKDKITGSIHNMYLFTGGGATLKLLFRKKSFYSNNG